MTFWLIDDDENINSPIDPTMPSPGMSMMALMDAQTSVEGSRTSRRWSAGSRELWEDARVPRRRLRTGRRGKRYMSPRAGGSCRTKVYERKGMCGRRWNAKKRWRISYTFRQSHNSGPVCPRSRISQVGIRSGVGLCRCLFLKKRQRR